MPQQWKSSTHYVSFYNFLPEARRGLKLPKKVILHDVTLRDGEQQARITFRREEKLKIAQALDEAGVERIEAGLPSVSPSDKQAVKEITQLKLDAKIYAFARCMKTDVDSALDVDVDGVVMEIPSSDHLVKYGYGWKAEKAVDLSVEATNYAHDHGLKVTFFTIDSTRASFEVISKLTGRVAKDGYLDALALADTFGVLNPQATAYFVKRMRSLIKKPVEIHAHNDFGLGVANALAAISAGSEVAHVTVNGIGERTGNTPMEELTMALEFLYGVKTGIRLEKLGPLSKLVSSLSEVMVPPQKPVVGDDIFTIESGIIAGWWTRLEKLGMPLEMYPFVPELVGHDPINMILGKKSGRDSILYKAEKLGIGVDDAEVDRLLTKVKALALEKKRPITDDEFLSLAGRPASRS
ncbi:MAG: pyruvate carboxyltransferase [Nitrososphaerota archaeon]|nr:pyruvate carboxyltransferase [Nitrososphaerota archaeon]